MNYQGYIKSLKWMVVIGALPATGLRVGLWSLDSPTPQAAKLPARPPIALVDLRHALDAEFAPVVSDGLLRESTGCGVAIGVIDHGVRRVFTYGAAQHNSIFEIGSVTKTFTGLALAQLAVQKKVGLTNRCDRSSSPTLRRDRPGQKSLCSTSRLIAPDFPAFPKSRAEGSGQPVRRLRSRRAASIPRATRHRETSRHEVSLQQHGDWLARIRSRRARRCSVR